MKKMKLTANILFAGIGCQERGFENSGVLDLDVLSTSEIDRYAILSYSAMHKGLTDEMVSTYDAYPSEAEMIQELMDKNIGYNPKNGKSYDWNKLKKDREYIIKKNWLANHLNHNLGDISRIQSLPQADLWTVSFPCQDISIAGRQKGFKEGSGTRSSLLWEQIRLLRAAIQDGTAPKFLMFENVRALVGKKFKADFLQLLNFLDELGYISHWKLLNAKDCGIPQNRERVFVICVRKDINIGSFSFPKPYKCHVKLESILNPDADRKIPLNQERLKAIVARLKGDKEYLDNKESACADQAQKETLRATDNEAVNDKEKDTYQVSRPTPQMCFQLMGLTAVDVKKCKALGVSDAQLYRQAGNGIVTNCVQLIGEHLYKAMKDPSFICTDEKMNGAGWRVTPIFLLNLEKKPA